ncbi:helix-turn-helix domain-containing protein [Pseudomonas benzenivorans]|uniref:helix-turn-helix transcriptional regulator n=1 Tax=Pseudomonas benzenivorans TaxID=556533 RepID=UPI0035155735
MSLPCLVWADLRNDPLEPSPVDALQAYFRLRHLVGPADTVRGIEQIAPLLACFEYDYPNLSGLKALRATKQAHPSLPILMLTVHHSEALAVWAFRTRVWDYLVKPFSAKELWWRLERLLDVLPAGQEGGRAIAMPVPLIPPEARIGRPDAAERMTQYALTYVQRHYGEMLRLQDVARCCHMSVYAFSRSFKRTYGLTFREYLCRYRLKRALELLQHSNASISEVACAAGFRNASHFSRLFHQRIGITPSQYRGDLPSARPCPDNA